MWASTACGAVKSMTTSCVARRAAVRAAAFRLSAAHRTETPWPRERAASATREPVLPRPRISRFIAERPFTTEGTEAHREKPGPTRIPLDPDLKRMLCADAESPQARRFLRL